MATPAAAAATHQAPPEVRRSRLTVQQRQARLTVQQRQDLIAAAERALAAAEPLTGDRPATGHLRLDIGPRVNGQRSIEVHVSLSEGRA
jgi:hypothetical protein